MATKDQNNNVGTQKKEEEKTTSSEEKKIVFLRSNDGQTFEVEAAVAGMSETIKQIIDDGIDGVIPIPNVNAKILSRVIEYCSHHARHSTKGKGKSNEEFRAWDKEFINVDTTLKFELVLAANYLNIKNLLELLFQAIADDIKDKTVEEVRVTFNIQSDFTPEEEEAIRTEHAWTFQ